MKIRDTAARAGRAASDTADKGADAALGRGMRSRYTWALVLAALAAAYLGGHFCGLG